MSEVPEGLLYTKTEEWVKVEGDIVMIGLTDHAQEQLGDIVYVELPEVGAILEKGSEFAVVESVKTAADIYAPISGKVLEVNETLADSPETMNESPYENGWMAKIELTKKEELESLDKPEIYKASLEE